MQLPVIQRSTVVLMDVLEYSLAETAQILGTTLPAVKAALHRGRVRLQALSEMVGSLGRRRDGPAAARPSAAHLTSQDHQRNRFHPQVQSLVGDRSARTIRCVFLHDAYLLDVDVSLL
jgi:RNA polymerase sigma-70 factor (ECF subfamily)